MDAQDSAQSELQHPQHDTPEAMLKRIFAVAEIVAKAKARRRAAHQKEQFSDEKTQDDETVVL